VDEALAASLSPEGGKMVPNQVELETLERSRELLRFGAENKSGLPPAVVADIEAAWEAQGKSAWDAQIAAKFWLAYDGLCSHLRPVTLDTFEATTAPIRSWLGWFWHGRTTYARRWAAIFLAFFIFLLSASLGVSIFVAAAESAIKEVRAFTEKASTAVDKIDKMIANRPPTITNDSRFMDQSIKPEDKTWILELRNQAMSLWEALDGMHQKTNAIAIRKLTESEYPLCNDNQDPATNHCYQKGRLALPANIGDVQAEANEYYNFFETRRVVTERTDSADTRLTAFKLYLLPVLLGMLGSCTFVIRSISDQIKDFTFSNVSPLRHLLRVCVGGIVGVLVVTFYTVALPTQLSILGWAFAAGYAMEPVFAAIDTITAKLK
jgi:hypothetical protein